MTALLARACALSLLAALPALGQTQYVVFSDSASVADLGDAALTTGTFLGGTLPGLALAGTFGESSARTMVYSAQGETVTQTRTGPRYSLEFRAPPIALTHVWMGDVLAVDLTSGARDDLLVVGAQSLEPPYRPIGTLYDNTGGSLNVGASLQGVYNARLASADGLVAVSGNTGAALVLDVLDYVGPSPGQPSGRFVTVSSLPGVELAALDLASDAQGARTLVASGIGADGVPVGAAFVQRAGEPGFARVEQSSVPALFGGAAKLADLDGDGLLDLLITGSRFGPQFLEGEAALLMGTPGGGFRPSGLALPPLMGSVADIADRDGDGDLDLLIAGGEGSPLEGRGAYYVYDGDGAGGFVLHATGPAPFGGDGGWVDLNGLGELDFVVSGTIAGRPEVRFYRGAGAAD
jgi:hypothetical protein